MHIDHINISAPKAVLAIEKDFFCKVFQLAIGYRPNFSRNGYWLYATQTDSKDKNALVHLTESDEHSASPVKHYLDHVAFQLTGLARLLAKLDELGISYRTDSLPDIVMTQVFFTSPAGIGLEANFLNEIISP
ncbi:hypothetical protein [Thalassotalea euphylliae]|uniref:Diguanylate cyclase n=1 Tax=Thalassotalea euphylliae TaxID=1655234 RepID=A0A3E0UFB6_9GAMM|nr:hypothetical protein [Thalassotalea euphylliae]REL35293.1 hypothetical protein DXX92_07965 [Thalassotalea euphylliae]